MKNLILSIATLLVATFSITAQTIIPPNNKDIHIHGAKFVKMDNGVLVMHRHPDELYKGKTSILRFNPEKALSSTGISIKFRTASPTVKVHMQISDKKVRKKPASGFIGVFQYKDIIPQPVHTNPVRPLKPNQKYNISYNKGKKFTINIKSEVVGDVVEYRITLPLFIDVNLVSLELEDGYNLKRYREKKKPIYVAYGNSITHGRSQKGAYETYPYLISEWNNWELYNLAVGGGKTSHEMAKMIADEFRDIDYMTVLIGYNDYAGGGESPDTYARNYADFLKTVRKEHRKTKIFCITLTATTTVKSPKSGYKAEEFRQVVRDIVKSRQKNGDKNIFLIEGEDISTVKDLKLKVHFTPKGALRVADKLYYEIKKNK